MTWTAYDMVASVSRGAASVSFDYGPDRARFRRTDVTSQGTTTTTYAGGKAMEEIAHPNGSIERKHYIGDFAVVTTTATSSATTYLHRDHLGSVDVVTSATGAVLQRMSFDAWGKRREITWLPMTQAAIAVFDTTLTTRGFTGHEMIDPVGLVHMNGRVYDPEIGRFLSADPHVQDLSNLQSWNRYTYVNNNPLSFTDPSGFFLSGLFRAVGHFFSSVFRAIGSVFKAILKSPIFRAILQIAICATPGVNMFGCAAASGLLTLASGGSVLDAVKAFAFSFAQMGAFTEVSSTLNGLQAGNFVLGTLVKAGVHGIIGGAVSLAQGGSFLQGFAGSAVGAVGGAIAGQSGLVGQYGDGNSANMLARALISGAAGCAGAIVTGGKCAQAAVTAAFASLYNGDGGARAGALAGRVIGGGLGVGLAGLCDFFTGGACAPAGLYIVAGSAVAGRFGGAAAGSWIEDWVRSDSDAEGQEHHAISRKIAEELSNHPNMGDDFDPRDERYTTRAVDKAAHNGYQTWHRELDIEVVDTIRNNPQWTRTEFLDWLRGVYNRPEISIRFTRNPIQ